MDAVQPLEMPLEVRFRAFVQHHHPKAVAMAWRLLGGDRAAAEDVAQEAFVQAWRALSGFRGDAALSTWFYRILIRQAQRHRRWSKVRRILGQAPEVGACDVRPDPGLQDRIAAALDGLSAGQREAFVLVHMEGLTVTEAAALLGKAEGTIKSHLQRALKALRVNLADLKEPK